VPKERILGVQAVGLSALQRVPLDVPATPLVFAVFLRVRGCVGNDVKPQCAANAR